MGTGKHCRWCWWVRVSLGGHGICRHCVRWCARMGMGGHDMSGGETIDNSSLRSRALVRAWRSRWQHAS